MIIDLASVGKVAKSIALEVDPSEIDLEGTGAAIKGKTEFAGEAQRVNGKVHVRGTISSDLLLDCTRCLERVERHFDVTFDDVFVDAREEPKVDELEVAGEELDEALVPDGKVD